MGFSDFNRKVYDRRMKANLCVLVHDHWTKAEYEEILRLGELHKGWRKGGGTALDSFDLLNFIIARHPETKFFLKMMLLFVKRREELAA